MVHSGAPNGYNQLHLTPLYDILNKVYLEATGTGQSSDTWDTGWENPNVPGEFCSPLCCFSAFEGRYVSSVFVNLHGKSDCFAEQEMYAAMTMFNFTSRIAREAVKNMLYNFYASHSRYGR